MVKNVGIDILEIKRLQDTIERKGDAFLKRIFTPKEIAYCSEFKDSILHFTGKYVAKEAVAKALGTGFGEHTAWQDIEILNETNGKPKVILSETLKTKFDNPQLLISISHCKKFATAIALWI